MGSAIKYPLAILLAAVTTLTLFFVMQALIAMGTGEVKKGELKKIADIHMPERELEVLDTEKKPEKPEEPEQPPPDLAPPPIDTSVPDAGAISMAPVRVDTGIKLGGIGLGASDGEYLPIVKVAPIYPSRALSRGIEGYVIVEFTVTKAGTVQNPVVVEAFTDKGNPTTIFNRAAIKAASKFKYKPKVIDGEPVDVAGVQNKITFKIAK